MKNSQIFQKFQLQTIKIKFQFIISTFNNTINSSPLKLKNNSQKIDQNPIKKKKKENINKQNSPPQ